MSPHSKTPLWSGTSPSKLDFIKSLRRRTFKTEQEPAPTNTEDYIPRPTRISSLTTETMASNLVHSPNVSPSSPAHRIRMSGNRLPSGYRPNVFPGHTPQLVAGPPVESQPVADLAHKVPQLPLRTRLTRLIPRNIARTTSDSTPTSSTLSFPSSSRASTSTAASHPKAVRFSPSTSFIPSTEQPKQTPRKVEKREKISGWTISSLAQGRDGTAHKER